MTTPYTERLPGFTLARLTVDALIPRLTLPLADAVAVEADRIAKDINAQVLDMVTLPPTGEGVEARGAWLKLLGELIDALHAIRADARAATILDGPVYGSSEAIHAAVQRTGDVFVRQEPYGYDFVNDELDAVIAQADYMSGDTFGVHAALTLNDTTGLAFFYEHGSEDHMRRANTLLRFYNSCPLAGKRRIALIPVTDARKAYRYSQEGYFPKSVFPWGVPKIVARTRVCLAIGNATRLVAAAYKTMSPAKATAALQAAWLPQGWETGAASLVPHGETIAQWVARKRFDKSKAYAFLWFRRSGALGGAHPELDTCVTATRDLIKTIKRNGLIENAAIVLVGDAGHGITDGVDIDLTEYWNDKRSPFISGDRRMQLALFAYLVKAGYNLMNIGMRSGALEGPALLGVRTVYLEEIYNLQEGRMDQWQGVVPGYRRIELGHVPSAEGRKALAATLAKNVTDNDYELKDAAAYAAQALGRGTAQGVFEAIFKAANGVGTASTTLKYDPFSVGEAFTALCAQWQRDLGVGSLRDDHFGADWADFAWRVKSGLRAAHALHKALVKQRICAAYKGPDEGLNDTDKAKLWDAVGGTIDTWQIVGKHH
ncbi:hypothetical protein [Actinocorallia sp. A-T 12471]|uniref:hypothetical protein n=1 Tax=Actinocorallia sp. A-T 12471 TaxID=3089813 RepID=UPI0029D0EBFD|nr:hypothetical protein [Actinocorallia sp. A-T 12471]MDX6743925.1 hypothetical protein [Actinocorallia sp. A-T 12471]